MKIIILPNIIKLIMNYYDKNIYYLMYAGKSHAVYHAQLNVTRNPS